MENFSFFKKTGSFLLLALILGSLSPSTAQANKSKLAFSACCAFLAVHNARLQYIDQEKVMTGAQFTERMSEAWKNNEYRQALWLLAQGYDDFVIAGFFGKYFWPRTVNFILALELINKFHLFFTKGENVFGTIFDDATIAALIA